MYAACGTCTPTSYSFSSSFKLHQETTEVSIKSTLSIWNECSVFAAINITESYDSMSF